MVQWLALNLWPAGCVTSLYSCLPSTASFKYSTDSADLCTQYSCIKLFIILPFQEPYVFIVIIQTLKVCLQRLMAATWPPGLNAVVVTSSVYVSLLCSADYKRFSLQG